MLDSVESINAFH